MTQMIFLEWFWHRNETRTYTNGKDLNNFQGLKWAWMQEMTKIPFFMNFANNIEIKCREICNWSETNSNDLKCKKNVFGWLEIQKT
jgi:hypothetical protein